MEDNRWCPEYGVNRYYSIDEKPPRKIRGKPSLQPGDIVKWKMEPWWTHKDTVGTVLCTRWVLVDWSAEDKSVNGTFYPEAQIMWSSGEMTNTSQSAVKRVSMREKKKPVREFDDGGGRQKSPAAPKKRKKTV